MTQSNTYSFHYILKNKRGKILEANPEPTTITQGSNQIFPKLESAIIAHKPGEQFDVTLTAKEAYGDYNDDLVFEIAKSEMDGTPPIGEKMIVTDDSGNEITAEIVDKKDTAYILDGNHPLAGEALTFSIELISVTPASDTASEAPKKTPNDAIQQEMEK